MFIACEASTSTAGAGPSEMSAPIASIHPLAAGSGRVPSRRQRRQQGRTPLAFFPFFLLVALLSLPSGAQAAVTVYTGKPTGVAPSQPSASYTGLPAYDPTRLTPPSPPSPPINSGNVALPANSAAAAAQGLPLSIPQKGNFLGFSIELSVADTLLGSSGRNLKPQFLNYLANIRNRAGAGPIIRIGGNTQDTSTIVPGGFKSSNTMIEKIRTSSNPTDTPEISYAPSLLYAMANVTSLVNAEWYFGLAFNYTDVLDDSNNIPIAAHYAQTILGSSLLGLAVGNEPDLYVDHGDRPANWTLSNYMSEFTEITSSVLSNGGLRNPIAFVGPSVCCNRTGFEVEDLIQAGWLNQNAPNLAAMTVQHYPTNNCKINGNIIDPQSIFPNFLNHTSAQDLTAPYVSNAQAAAAVGKELVMLEMNSASCGGFPGLSDSFGVAMWMADWALQMAYANFTSALMHVGGQNVYYNPFTPPPSSQSNWDWTTGSVYYSTLVMAEAMGSSNASRVIDITAATNSSIYHPAYAVYENDAPSRVVLFNYVSDPSGASTYYATVSIPNGNVASSVSVRYLAAPDAAEQYNITWAGQTMGLSFNSDGRLSGNIVTQTLSCQNGQCVVPVPAPAIAVVYLTPEALQRSSVPQSAEPFTTTVIGYGSQTINPAALKTSNGQNGPEGVLGTNSKNGAAARRASLTGVPVAVFTAAALAAVAFMTTL